MSGVPSDGASPVFQLEKKLAPEPWDRSWWQCAALGLELVAAGCCKRSGTLKIKVWR